MNLLLFAASTAFAAPNFPPIVETDAGMPCQPTCTLCHQTNAGGSGTVTQPFGTAMIDRGLVVSDPDSIQTALDAMAADAVDSDGDGVIDVDELAAGDNPNDDTTWCGGGVEPPLTPEYGCLNTAPFGAGGFALLAVAAAVAGGRRQR